jgi:tetratricopeptide (TPR) repeat protein
MAHFPLGRAADVCLLAVIIATPVAAGGWDLQLLPFFGALGCAAFVFSLLSARAEQRAIRPTGLMIGFALLAAFTALQALPLGSFLSSLSPTAADLRSFVVGDPTGSISYESGATWREAAKLVLYLMIAVAAHEHVRSRKSQRWVAHAVVLAGVVTVGTGVIHRVLGIDRLFGVKESVVGGRFWTTFVNSNHEAGFMSFCALVAMGVALETRDRRKRIAYLICAAVFGGILARAESRGGVLALLFGLGLFGALFLIRRRTNDQRVPLARPAIVAVALVAPVVALLWRATAVLEGFGWRDPNGMIGIDEKLAAIRDAIPLVGDHPWLGIGRGAYVSVYSHYKSSPLQLTFAFPENIVVQLIAEWGVVVGAAAIGGLSVGLILRLLKSKNVLPIAAACGVALVVAHNLVDFSLEMPGVAVPVIATLASIPVMRGPRLPEQVPSIVVMVVPPLALLVTIGMAFSHGQLSSDLHRVDEAIAARSSLHGDDLLARHPSSAPLAAKLAYLAEISDPPDFKRAIRYANRALYLAPTYADAHLMAGRLLIQRGHRMQGFGELRWAWSLAADRKYPFIRYVVSLAENVEEVQRAIPRRDAALDVMDEQEVARTLKVLSSAGKPEWGRTLLEQLPPIDEIPSNALQAVAQGALEAGDLERAIAAISKAIERSPSDERSRLLYARLCFRRGDFAQTREMLRSLPVNEESLMLAANAALEMEDFDGARQAADALQRLLPEADSSLGRVALLRASIERRAGEPAKALSELDEALSIEPSNIALRMERASILAKIGRIAEAQLDAQFVLRRAPNHPRAKALLNTIGKKAR